jgi:uncharacterized membrane protein (UPF0136 family)
MKKMIPLFSFALVLFGLHIAIIYLLLEGQSLRFILATHAFLFSFLLAGNLAMRKVKSIDPKKVGMTFLTITVFIFVIKQNSSLDKNEIIFNFFGVFFLYLIYEVFTAIKELK